MAAETDDYLLRMPPGIGARVRAEADRRDVTMRDYLVALLDEHTPPMDGEPARAGT